MEGFRMFTIFDSLTATQFLGAGLLAGAALFIGCGSRSLLK